MVITYHGAEFFKVSFGDTTLALNPISKDSKLKSSSFGSDIVLISLNHPDMNGAENAARGDKEPFVIRGPGEYEIGGIFVKGFQSMSHYGGKEAYNTIYHVELEGMHLLYLGATDESKLPGELGETLEAVDVLFIPIGGEGVLSAKDAASMVVDLEPKLVLPMHFGDVGAKDSLGSFMKETGGGKAEPTEKLTLKKKDLEGKTAEIVVLSS